LKEKKMMRQRHIAFSRLQKGDYFDLPVACVAAPSQRRLPKMTMVVDVASSLELGELLDGLAGAGKDTEDVEADLEVLLEAALEDVTERSGSRSWREVCTGQR
jgi:hypothetical protein